MTSIEQHLQQHGRALRALARDLVGDGHADDLLQDAAVEALLAPPRRPGPLGGWFAQVMRHLAGKHHRREGRRQRREGAAARDQVLDAPDSQLATAEVFADVNAAVLGLPSVYRDAVLRRYLREESPAKIAEDLGLPVATVKSRLQRGLVMLREHFASRGRADWRAHLAAAIGIDGAAKGILAAAGTTLMTVTTKWCVVAAAAAVLLWLAWPLGPSPVAGEPPIAALGDQERGDATEVSPRRVAASPQTTESATSSIVLLDAADGQPLANRAVHLLWGDTRRTQSDEHGRVVLPAGAVPEDAWCAVEGWYPEAISDPVAGELRLRRSVTVSGIVAAAGGIDVTDLVVDAVCVGSQPPLGSGGRPTPVGADLRFEFVPRFEAEHELSLCWRREGRLSAPLAVARWRPGEASVTLVVTGAAAREPECDVSVELEFDAAVQLEIERSRAAKLAAGYELTPRYGQVLVEVVCATATRVPSASSMQRCLSIEAGRCLIEGLRAPAGEGYVQVMVFGIGLTRRLGPFALRAPTMALHAVIDSAGEVDVRMVGGGVADLVQNPVAFLARDASGESLGAFYADDGAGDGALIPGRLMPLGKVWLWPQASTRIGGRAVAKAARPQMVVLAKGQRPEVGFELVEVGHVLIDLSDVRGEVRHAWIVDPVSGGRRALQIGPSSRASDRVASGPWRIDVALDDGTTLSVPFEAVSGEHTEVRVRR